MRQGRTLAAMPKSVIQTSPGFATAILPLLLVHILKHRIVRLVAAELGVNAQSLPEWKQQFKALPGGQVAGTLEALQAENRRLQKELRRVAQQRDILKKTLGIISEPSEGGLNG